MALAFDLDTGAAVDPVILEAGSDEGVYVAEFDLERIRRYRSKATWGGTNRRPETYSVLIEN
jgi:hypothetical protein